jgi:hypothetical protein
MKWKIMAGTQMIQESVMYPKQIFSPGKTPYEALFEGSGEWSGVGHK